MSILLASSNDCTIEARLSDSFRIKKADFDAAIIVRKFENIHLINILFIILVYHMTK
jgi:hypothetical protein